MPKLSTLSVAVLLAVAGGAAQARISTTPSPAPVVATAFTSGSIAAGQVLSISFTLTSGTSGTFSSLLGNSGLLGFDLYSGSTKLAEVESWAAPKLNDAFSGLSLGQTYSIHLSNLSGAATTYAISSTFKGSSVTVTSLSPVPEANASLLALAGAGVVGGLAMRRRKQA